MSTTGMADMAGTRGRDFVGGFAAMLPLWSGAIPVGVAFAVAADAAGLSMVEAQLMSLTVFSAATQVSAATQLGAGTSLPVVLGTALALNVQLLLIGLAAGRVLRPAWASRLPAAFLLTEGAYAVALASGRFSLGRLLGAGASMYLGWNLGTALGSVAGAALAGTRGLGLELVAPLAFLAVLVPLVRTRAALLAASVAAVTALVLRGALSGGTGLLAAALTGSIAGTWAAGRRVEAGEATRDGG